MSRWLSGWPPGVRIWWISTRSERKTFRRRGLWLHDQGWGATETHRCAFEVGTLTCAPRVAVLSLRGPGPAGVPACLLLSLPVVLPPAHSGPAQWSCFLSLFLPLIQTARGPGPPRQGKPSSGSEERELSRPGIGGRPDQATGFHEEDNDSQRLGVGAEKVCSHFKFSLLAETNFSVKTMKNLGGVSSPEQLGPPGRKALWARRREGPS